MASGPAAARPSRKADALAFITRYLVEHGHSPSIGDVAAALKVGRTRAKALIHQLAQDKAIERAPGAQRAISVPGLFDQLVVDRLRADGWTVNPLERSISPPCPQEHLSLMPALEQFLTDDDSGEAE